jgi:nitroimidazol reductase NimA-like FMN-containing flavoprotein (pyridoxamine 5'-phosphate oxidase superfamily)
MLEVKEIGLIVKPLLSKIPTAAMTLNRDDPPYVTPTSFMCENGKFIITMAERAVEKS